MKKLMSVIAFAVFFGVLGLAQDCSPLEKSKKQVYGFKPSQLGKAEQAEKSKQMDGFWELAKAHRDGKSCLMKMLDSEPDNSFFLYDGAQLLLRLDKSQPLVLLQTVAKAMARSDLKDVDIADYLQTTRMLDAKGVDTSALADKYMAAANVEAFIPQHSLKVERFIGAVFLYGTMTPEKVDDHVSPFLQSADPKIKSAAIYMLSLNMSPRSFSTLRGLKGLSQADQKIADSVLRVQPVKTKERSKYTREQILAKLKKFPEMDESDSAEGEDKEIDNSIVMTLQPDDLELLRAARSRGITGVSDESLYRYFDLSRLMMSVINKNGMYADARQAVIPQ